MSVTNRRCKYCGAYLKSEYLKGLGMNLYCDNDDCEVKPITEYNNASNPAFRAELNEISLDKWEDDDE